jgi:hypothetical protein
MSADKHPGGRPPIGAAPATGHIHLRTTMKRKTAYVKAAKPGKLTAWIVHNLDAAAKSAGQDPGPTPDDYQNAGE